MPIWMLLAIMPLVIGGPDVAFCQLELVLEILVLAGLRQVLLEQAKLLQNDTAGHRIGGGILRADADFEGLCACGRRRQPDGCGNEQGKEAREFGRRADAH